MFPKLEWFFDFIVWVAAFYAVIVVVRALLLFI